VIASVRNSLLGIVSITMTILALLPALAEEQGQSLPGSIEKRLQEFDPASVAAARHYYTCPVHKAALAAMLPKIVEVMGVSIEHGNPGLDPTSKREAVQAAQEAVSARLDLMTDMGMVAALEVVSKKELIALDQFYSSPLGQSVEIKMPQVLGRLPAMMQVIMPLMLEDVRAKMKAKGKELHL
jgi:Uncharacterized protein conserved in bacteria (DUF2059)